MKRKLKVGFNVGGGEIAEGSMLAFGAVMNEAGANFQGRFGRARKAAIIE